MQELVKNAIEGEILEAFDLMNLPAGLLNKIDDILTQYKKDLTDAVSESITGTIASEIRFAFEVV